MGKEAIFFGHAQRETGENRPTVQSALVIGAGEHVHLEVGRGAGEEPCTNPGGCKKEKVVKV